MARQNNEKDAQAVEALRGIAKEVGTLLWLVWADDGVSEFQVQDQCIVVVDKIIDLMMEDR